MTDPLELAIHSEIETVRSRLQKIVQEKSIKIAPPDEPFVLTSGLKSHYYINGKKTCCDPEGLFSLCRLILERIRKYNVNAIGGPTLGADPIVGAVTALSHLIGPTIPWFIVRKEPKGHGTQSQIEGADIAGKRVVIVEDVITTGGSVLKAIDVVRSLGCEVVDVIAIVDREQGGVEAFETAEIPYSPIFTISELLPAEVLQRSTS